MTISTDDALAALTAANDHVATHAELLGTGLRESTIARRCGPGGPWQRLLPRTYLLHTGQPTHSQRMRMALRYGEHGRPGSAVLRRGRRCPCVTDTTLTVEAKYSFLQPNLTIEWTPSPATGRLSAELRGDQQCHYARPSPSDSAD